MHALIAFLVSSVASHAANFEAHVILASSRRHSALVSITSGQSIAFGHCTLPQQYAASGLQGVPLETLLDCRPIGVPVPNTPMNQRALEKYFKVFLADRIKRATGGEAFGPIARRSGVMGAIVGAVTFGATSLVGGSPLKQRLLISGGTTAIGAISAAILAYRNVWSSDGSAAIVQHVRQAYPITRPAAPIVLEDLAYAGVLPRNGFSIAKASLKDAIDRLAMDLSVLPGGGSSGGAGSTSAW
jgi:hypothetical protein